MNRAQKFALFFVVFASTLAFADKPPKPGTFYKDSQLGIRKKELKGTKLHVTFTLQPEQFYWCPGVQVKHTSKATVVTFVRSKTSQNGKIDKKAKFDKKMTSQVVVIDTKKRDTYIRNGAKTFKQIYSPNQNKGSSTKTKNASATKPGKKKSERNSPAAASSLKESGAQPVGELRPSVSSPIKRKILLNDFVLPSSD